MNNVKEVMNGIEVTKHANIYIQYIEHLKPMLLETFKQYQEEFKKEFLDDTIEVQNIWFNDDSILVKYCDDNGNKFQAYPLKAFINWIVRMEVVELNNQKEPA